jgi:hypothetical protein
MSFQFDNLIEYRFDVSDILAIGYLDINLDETRVYLVRRVNQLYNWLLLLLL